MHLLGKTLLQRTQFKKLEKSRLMIICLANYRIKAQEKPKYLTIPKTIIEIACIT